MAKYSATLDPVFHALADTTRRSVLQRLALGEASVSDLFAPFDMAMPSFLKHIRVLETAGLLVSRKVGRVRYCRLEAERLLAAERWFEEQRSQWESRFDNLDSLLDRLQASPHDEH